MRLKQSQASLPKYRGTEQVQSNADQLRETETEQNQASVQDEMSLDEICEVGRVQAKTPEAIQEPFMQSQTGTTEQFPAIVDRQVDPRKDFAPAKDHAPTENCEIATGQQTQGQRANGKVAPEVLHCSNVACTKKAFKSKGGLKRHRKTVHGPIDQNQNRSSQMLDRHNPIQGQKKASSEPAIDPLDQVLRDHRIEKSIERVIDRYRK